MQNENFSQIDDALNKAASRVLATSLSSLMQMPNRDRFIYQFEDLPSIAPVSCLMMTGWRRCCVLLKTVSYRPALTRCFLGRQ